MSTCETFYFLYWTKQWFKLHEDIRSIKSAKNIKKVILDFIAKKENSVYAIHDIPGPKLLTRLRSKFSHLNECKFRHNFKNSNDPMCPCGLESETTDHTTSCAAN